MTWRLRSEPHSPAEMPRQVSFEEIVLPNLDAAYGLARWLVGDPNLAEDVVHDAVVRGLSYFATYRGGDGRAWLMRIVRNTAYSMLATRKHVGLPVAAGLTDDAVINIPDPGASPEDAIARQQDSARLEQALAALPVDLRECLVLKELEELSYKEIALITGVPIGTVMSRLWRARRILRATGQEGVSDEP